jgi:hypothetical protein
MSSKLSPAARASIKADLSTALAASRTPGAAPVSGLAPTSGDLAPTRAAPPVQIDVADLVQSLHRAIAAADELDLRPQRPMVTNAGFETQSRFYERRYDSLSCFTACLTGALQVHAPEAAALIDAFLARGYAAAAAIYTDTNQVAQERTTTPCQP